MADNAIDKLIDELRAAKIAIYAAECGVADARAAVQAAEEKQRAAFKRREILERTMHKHIYEDMPIVQAKMQAHEEIENGNYRSSFNSDSFTITGPNGTLARIGSLSAASSAQSAASIATSSACTASGYASITKWLAGRNAGSC
ncbi:hypothetical protein [Sphingobium yanoikuyae]|uniref:hypothetical protein n=1 Tax=Sphingobium yanoikuyae TaxID=13690 RepID=UPI0028B21C04|nr:hypothetical protein [Sphingobium yanoikuyae]